MTFDPGAKAAPQGARLAFPEGALSIDGNPRSPREPWIDTLRGIGIVAVAAGHVVSGPALVAAIFLFHMPLFFLIGGWLHRTDESPGDYFRSRAFSLLLPYGCYLLILWPLELLAAFPDQAWTGAWLLRALVKPMLLGGPLLKGYAAVFWFVTCYFLTQQLIHHLLRNYSPRACAFILAAMLAAAYGQAALMPRAWLPWSMHTVLFAAPIYFIGHCIRGQDFRRLIAPWPLWLAAGVGAMALAVLQPGNTLDMKYAVYGVPLLTLVSSLIVTGLLARCALLLHKVHLGAAMILAAGLSSLGRASMTIMFLHQPVQLALWKLCGVAAEMPRIAAALLLPYLLHQGLERLAIGRRLLLGRRAPRTPWWLRATDGGGRL